MSTLPGPSLGETRTQNPAPAPGDGAANVAFARDRVLGLVAATSDSTETSLAATVLRHFGFTFDVGNGLWRLPARMLWVDQVLAAAQASTLLTGLGHTVVADGETRTTALALAAQHTTPARSPGATLVETPARHTPATPAPSPQRR